MFYVVVYLFSIIIFLDEENNLVISAFKPTANSFFQLNDGVLKIGDRIAALNGINTESWNLQEFSRLF